MSLGAAAQAAVDDAVAASTAFGAPGVDRTKLGNALARMLTESGDGVVRFVCDVGPTDADPLHKGNVPLVASDIPCINRA